ncbi:MAG: cytochrome c biogenesis protein CcsA [Chloroflexi bacterium]|nr:cytochrome c biogenesis protein CcsA [Chloroflexota bacterium]
MARKILLWLTLVLMMIALYMVFVYVPTEKEMGIVQRIFYLMVPAGWLAMLSFTIVFLGSILYLVKRVDKWDIIARSSSELGIVFTTMALIVGPIWAKPIWGVWWDWGTPRLPATLILWFIYLAYFMVRSFAAEESRGARFAAVVGIVGFVDIPIIALSNTLWQREQFQHPGALVFQGGLDPKMTLTLMVSIFAFTALYCLLLLLRVSLRNAEIEIRDLKELSD